MRTTETKYRVFKIVDEPIIGHQQYCKLESCTHIEFEKHSDAEHWLKENGDYHTATHQYTVLPCIRILHEDEETGS